MIQCQKVDVDQFQLSIWQDMTVLLLIANSQTQAVLQAVVANSSCVELILAFATWNPELTQQLNN